MSSPPWKILMTKRCSSCKKIKPVSEFHKNKAKEDGYQNQCKVCKKKVNQAYVKNNSGRRKQTIDNYYSNNREAILKRQAVYRAENPEKRKETARKSRRKSYAANPDKFRLKAKEWREENPEKAKKTSSKSAKKAYKKNPEKFKKKTRGWKEANPDKVRKMNRHRQSLKRAQSYSAEGHVSRDIEKILMRIQEGKCYYCQGNLVDLGFHREHKIPLSRGGLHDDSNLVLSCPSCNLEKGAKTDKEFMESTR